MVQSVQGYIMMQGLAAVYTIREHLKGLRSKGLSYGAIGEKVFDKYGYTLDPRDVRRIILGLTNKKKEKKGV